MKTYVIQIENSDNKLTQKDWAEYIIAAKLVVRGFSDAVHFIGYSSPTAELQNAAFVFSLMDSRLAMFTIKLKELCMCYRQSSIAIMVGETKYINANDNVAAKGAS